MKIFRKTSQNSDVVFSNLIVRKNRRGIDKRVQGANVKLKNYRIKNLKIIKYC